MVEAIFIAVGTEILITGIALIATIPSLKKELARLNNLFEKSIATQEKLVKQTVRLEERLDNHIKDTHIHNN